MNSLAKTTPDSKLLRVFENIKKSIAEIDDIKELQDLRNLSDGFETSWQKYYRASGFGFDQMFLGWETKVRSERRMGEMLSEMELKKGVLKRGDKLPQLHDETTGLDDLGISKIQSHRYQQIARILDEKFDKIIEELRLAFREPTTSALFKTAHVSYSTGEDEWYTPPAIIELARKTMGSIDLDPASCEEANKIVKAKKHFTAKDDGLSKDWFGNVWINPPFSEPTVQKFTQAVADKYISGEIKQGCIIINNATETRWFQYMASRCSAICFPKGRIRFLDKNSEQKPGSPLQGQAILYFGKNTERFENNFRELGLIVWLVK